MKLTKLMMVKGSAVFLLAWFSGAVAAAGVRDPEFPSKIVHLGKNSSGLYAVFNQGSTTGFVIGRDVCIYNALVAGADKGDSKSRVKIHCGAIVRTKSHAAAIIFVAGLNEKILLGMDVWPLDLGSIKGKSGNKDADARTKADIAELALQQDDPPEPVLPPLLKSRFQAHLAPTYALPIWMNDMRFNTGARSSGSGKIWESGDTIKGSVVGFGLRYHTPLNGRGESAYDFTYHFVPQRPVKDDFDRTDGSTSIESSVWSHHYRFRWLRGATWNHSETSDLLLYTGFGYDFLQARFRSAKTGGSTDELVSGTITGHGLEIPVVIAWQKYLGGWLLTTGADMALPLGVYGVKKTGKLSYDEDVGRADKSLSGAEKAVNVRRGWFSVALNLGIGADF